MDYLEEINRQIKKKLSQKHKDIIISTYSMMILNHNDLCGCNYCRLLKIYIEQKKYLASLKRTYYNDSYYDSRVGFSDLVSLESRKNYIKTLKLEKDKLKTI